MGRPKRPKHCKKCDQWHRAGHPEGSRLHGSGYDSWCCRYSRSSSAAVGMCKLRGNSDPDHDIQYMYCNNCDIRTDYDIRTRPCHRCGHRNIESAEAGLGE